MQLPGIILASLATLCFGLVLGPEMPLILIGGGLAVVAVRLTRRTVPDQAMAVIAGAGSFAAISTLLGSPIIGAFLLMEATGLGGPMLGLVLIPGLLAAGIGSLIFLGLDSLTGLGTFSLAIPGLPPFSRPDLAEFGWAVVIGIAAALVGSGLKWLARRVQGHAEQADHAGLPRSARWLSPGWRSPTRKGPASRPPTCCSPVSQRSARWSRTRLATRPATVVLLVACKCLAYAVSLGSFRGGPVFPSMFIGAAGGIALSHLPGLPEVPGVAMGIGAMCAVMLTLPLTSVLLATLLLASDGLAVMPLVIVAVVVAYVASARLGPPPAQAGEPAGQSQPAGSGGWAPTGR